MSHDIISALQNILSSYVVEPYIRHMRFPKFKNLIPDARIDFNFPFTVLIGGNGTNKTSVLRALQGCPDQCNIGQYWFSTDLDEIKDTEQERSCFIYGYKIPCGDNRIVEILKTRIHKSGALDYWEPSRPIKKYSMEMQLPKESAYSPYKSKTRWNAVKKNVVYIDFRENLCAYDKYFYFGTFTGTKTFKNKQDRIRDWSRHLKIVADESRNTYKYGIGYSSYKERICKNQLLEESAVQIISNILGRDYRKIRMITHTFFDSKEGTTILLKGNEDGYSEAFAGSGESAVVMSVVKIHNAPERSLILLDEPETSLHPAAQSKLRDYLLGTIREKHHQVVMSTHSPAFAEGLPPEAIKIFSFINNKEVAVFNTALYQEAFHVVGAPNVDHKTIFVEDRLAVALLQRVIKVRRPNLVDIVEIVHLPGGAEQIITSSLVANAISARANVFYVLDGDKQTTDSFQAPEEIAEQDLDVKIREYLNIKVEKLNLPFDSNNYRRKEQKNIFLKRILLYLHEKHLLYFPEKMIPEALILKYACTNELLKDDNGKKTLKQVAIRLYNKENPDGDEIFHCAKMLMGSIPADCSMFDQIETILKMVTGETGR